MESLSGPTDASTVVNGKMGSNMGRVYIYQRTAWLDTAFGKMESERSGCNERFTLIIGLKKEHI